MAQFYPNELPNVIRQDPKRSAEVEIYDTLRLQLGARWIVFYSVAWLGKSRNGEGPQDGETDFIIAHPEYGILLLEVKGGRIAYDGARRTWTTTDRDDFVHDIHPFEQAVKCKYALLEMLKAQPGRRDEWISLGHAVAFPHAAPTTEPLLPDAPRDIILFADDLTQMHRRIGEIFEYWRRRNGPGASNEELMTDLRRLLAPTLTLPNPLSVQVAAHNREILRLTEEQFSTLDLLRRTRRAAISGCAGSGKTMLAAEKARRLSEEGFRTLLVCTSPPLADHLEHCLNSSENIHVYAFAELCDAAAEEANLPKPQTLEDGPQTLSAAMVARPALRFDAVLVDEGQNFDDLAWLALEDCLRENGIFYVFYDDNQRVTNSRGRIPSELHPIPLDENVRNTRAIHQATQPFYVGDGSLRARGPAGRPPEILPYTSPDELPALLARTLNRLVVAEGVSAVDIVVLTPRVLSGSSLPDLSLSNGFHLVAAHSANHREIQVASIADFQGLERPVVLVAELDDRFAAQSDARDALWYVALSRASSHVLLLGHPAVLEQVTP